MKKSQKYVLCIGGGKDVPFLLKNVDKKTKIILVDKNPKNPSIKFSKYFINTSYYNFKKIINYLKQENLQFKVKNIIFRTTGNIMFKIAYLYELLNINFMPPESAKILTHKNKLSKFCHSNKIPFPKSYSNINCIKNENLPVFLRPALSSGKRGLKIVSEKKKLKKNILKVKKISENDICLIEEYIKGRDIALIGQCTNNKFYPTLFMEEILKKNQRPLIQKIIGNPEISNEVKSQCINIAKKLCKLLKIKKTQFNLQFKLNDKNELFLIEIHTNFAGDHILENLYKGFKDKNFFSNQLNNFLCNKQIRYPTFRRIVVYFYWKKKNNRSKYFHLKKITKIYE